MAETYNIVASPSSPCPGEFIGEPCLILEQYAASPSQDSNVTLVIESGTHRLQSEAVLATRVDYFTMLADHDHKDAACIVFYDPRPIYYYYYHYLISYAATIHISRIHFSSSTRYTLELRIWNVQELFIKDCSFQEVRVYLSQVSNAVILQTCFYNGSSLSARSSTVNITRCTFRNNMQAVYFYSYSSSNNNALSISESTFINNTYTSAYTGGAAVYVRVPVYSRVLINTSIFVNNTAVTRGGALSLYLTEYTDSAPIYITECTFVNNTAVTGEGGALYLAGNSNSAPIIYITGSTFIYNSANSSNCGAISVQDTNNTSITISDSNFYYNRANSDGGVACVRSANINITKSTFVQNIAIGNGGALLLDESNLHISSILFKNNRAGQDGGALATYIYPSTYTIIQSTFTDNHAADDGGAVFIGCAESILRVELSTFSNNHAIDRGGAITLYGGRVDMITTNVYNNVADLGISMCTCSSEVNTSFSAGQRDITQPECTNYDTNINYHDLHC